MYFRDYWMSKTCWDQSLKRLVSEHPLAVNMIKDPKPPWNLERSFIKGCLLNLYERSFINFFDHSEGKWLRNYISYGNLKAKGCLLTHWLLMLSNVFWMVGICSSLFNCNYIKNKNHFLNLLCYCWNLHEIINIFEKR